MAKYLNDLDTATSASSADLILIEASGIDKKITYQNLTSDLAKIASTKTDGSFYTGTTDPSSTTRLNYDGYFWASKIYNAVFNDLAEFMEKAEDAEPGQCMVMTENGVVPSRKRGDKAVVGIYSDSFGYALGAEDQENKIPIGISGCVWVKIKELVEIGDLLISDVDGFVCKANDEEIMIPGIKVGKALQNKTTFGEERIKMLIMNI